MPKRSNRKARPIRISGGPTAWEQGLSSVFVELAFQQADPLQRLVGLMYNYPFGDLTFTRAITRGGAHTVRRSRALIEASRHNNFYIGCILAGRATLSQGEHRAELDRGDLAILDSTREYAIEVPHGFDALWVRVPRYRLEGRLTSINEVMAERINGKSGVGLLASNLLRTSLQEAANITAHDANRIANALLDLMGMSLDSHLKSYKAPKSHTKSLLREIQDYIDSHIDDEEMSLDTIAAAHSVSVRYLNKIFQREGVSTAKWIRMRRLERCRADLEDPTKRNLSISQIGFGHGFGNISSFNRAFKARFGVAPKAFRSF
jgi:AraC family transcriptional activator of tynA and feaB